MDTADRFKLDARLEQLAKELRSLEHGPASDRALYDVRKQAKIRRWQAKAASAQPAGNQVEVAILAAGRKLSLRFEISRAHTLTKPYKPWRRS
jgi:hypothetical protein